MSLKTLPPIEQLNSTSEKDFFDTVHILFETAPPLARQLFAKRPFSNYEQLIAIAEQIVSGMNFEDKMSVINAHPRIGTNPLHENISSFSYKEQGCDLDEKTEKEKLESIYARLKALNDEYESKFGFKFVVFVNGRSKEQIIPILEKRLEGIKDDELKIGLSEQFAIARDRLKKYLPKTKF